MSNCLSYWYPKIVGVVPTPKTEIVRADNDLTCILDGQQPKGYTEFIRNLRKAICAVGGRPVFLRTGHTSGKFEWGDTCFVADNGHTLARHVSRLVQYSHVAHIMGLPTDVWAVREILPTTYVFVMDTGMPITREIRVFVEDGTTLCVHPYWPKKSVLSYCSNLSTYWEDAYANMSDLHDISAALQFAELASKQVSGKWSVDVLFTTKGWYVIDMAHMEDSWHWPGCRNALPTTH